MANSLWRVAVAVFSLVIFAGAAQAPQGLQNVPAELVAYPDLILYNGKIVSMDDSSLNNSPGRTYEAMAVRGDRIQFLGQSQQLLRYAGPETRKIDLRGRTVIPGLIDTHNHLHNGMINLWASKNIEKIEPIVRHFSVGGQTFAEIKNGIELVIKEHWTRPEPGQWAEIELPSGSTGTGIGIPFLLQGQLTRKELDALAPNLPVLVTAGAGAWLLNTTARNDLLQYYQVPPTDENEELAITIGSVFDRTLITDRYFDTHMDELVELLEDQLKNQAGGGFTTYSSHIVGLRFMPAFRKLVVAGRMPMRLAFSHRYCQQIEPDNAGCFLRVGDWQGLGDPYYWNVGLTLGGIDAGPPTICSTMEAPAKYKEQEQCILQPGNAYWKAIEAALRSRYRYTVNHAYGDKGVDYVMDIMEQVMKENPDITLEFMRSLRVTSDHCGFYPRPAQLPRMKRLGMILSCNPMYVNRSAPWLKVYGADKSNRISPVATMIQAGVMPTAEFEGLNLASGRGPTPTAFLVHLITRKNDRGDLIAPEEAIDRVSALKMATIWASYFVLKENELGSLEPGKYADFVVFSKDYFTVPEGEIPTVYPLMTVLGGKTIVLREEFAKELGAAPVGPEIQFEFETEYDFGAEIQ